jgi:hypothetical protein
VRKVETYGSIKNGILKISYRSQFDQAMRSMPDCRVKLTVEKLYRKRSTEQNAYYWGVIVNECMLGFNEMTGQYITKEQAHEILKLKCNANELHNETTGEVMNVPGSTATLTTVQMMEYWLRCRDFVLEWFNRTIPEPNEQAEMEFKS